MPDETQVSALATRRGAALLRRALSRGGGYRDAVGSARFVPAAASVSGSTAHLWIAAGLAVLAVFMAALGLVGLRDRRRRVEPDALTPELREALGLWRDDHPGEGAARREDAFLSPQFLNSRQVAVNFTLAVLCLGLAIAALVVRP